MMWNLVLTLLTLSCLELLDCQTTTEEITTATATDAPTTTEPPTTTENPANFPKTGDLELLVEDLMYSGNMMHWSTRLNYLVIADIWGQRYIRFQEKEPLTTTVVPDTTTASGQGRQSETETTTSAAASEETTTTEVPTTTAEPLPYDVHYLTVSSDVVFLIRPQDKMEGSYPIIVPLYDQFNMTREPWETNNVLLAFNERIHINKWSLDETLNNLTYPEWSRVNTHGRLPLKNFMTPSPAWVDPNGRLLVAEKEMRPFKDHVSNSNFFVLPNTMEAEYSLGDLQQFAYQPNGMAWSTDNTQLYYSDGFNKAIYKCTYDNTRGDVSDCEELFNVADNIGQDAVPKGIVTDTSDHLWLALANVDGKGSVIELDPETNNIITTLDVADDSNLVDLAFAGEDLDFLYVMSDKHLYKVTGLGVTGRNVTEFIWKPDF